MRPITWPPRSPDLTLFDLVFCLALSCVPSAVARRHLAEATVQPPCLQMCGLNLNTNKTGAELLTVPLLNIREKVSVGHKNWIT
jgi:hypothetical protein